MPEYGNAIEAMHSDPEWKIDPDNPLVWAPPFPADKLELIKHTITYNFKKSREATTHADLASATKFEFVRGPVRYYIETIYQLDEDDGIVYGPDDQPIILETIRHTDTWMYSFGWYVNTDAPTAPGKSGFTQGGWTTRNEDNREVIEIPLDA